MNLLYEKCDVLEFSSSICRRPRPRGRRSYCITVLLLSDPRGVANCYSEAEELTAGGDEVNLTLFALDATLFTTSVVRNILIAVPTKTEKQPLSVTHPELAKEAVGWDPSKFTFPVKSMKELLRLTDEFEEGK